MAVKCSHCAEDRNGRCSFSDCPWDVDFADELAVGLRARIATLEAEVAEAVGLLRMWSCVDFERMTEHDDALLESNIADTTVFLAAREQERRK